jgi:hypothetical protein
MNHHSEQKADDSRETPTINKKRRILLGAGALAPVALTLVSPSVLGAAAECLSQQMSGNTSHHGAGSCTTGKSPADWKLETIWPTGFVYGTSGATCAAHSGGTPFNSPIAFPNDNEIRQMAAILCESITSLEAYFVAALLNSQSSGYILTPSQVRGLRDSSCPPPPNMSVYDFLASTWAI